LKERAKEALESFRHTTSLNMELLFIVLGVLVLVVLVLVIIKLLFFGNNSKSKFLKFAKSKGLSSEEADFLYSLAHKLNKDPFLPLKFKSSFEKVIHYYVNTTEDYNEDFIKNIRKKLGFDKVHRFSPLTTTKDIEIFQKARITVLKNMLYLEAILSDKDEKYMYWHLSDIDRIHPEFLDSDVEITFVRPDDGIYKFESKVDAIYMDKGKVIMKVPHSLNLIRIQRRKHARVNVNLRGNLGIVREEKDVEKVYWISGEILNISAGGVKFCSEEEIPGNEENIKKLTLKFKLDNITIVGEVKPVREERHETEICYGLKFTDISSRYEELIHDYVRKKQVEMKKLID